MDFLQPSTWDEALAAKAAHPDAVPLCGGTDVMVELNFDRRRPAALLDLTRVRELREWEPQDGQVRLGAAVTYSRVIDELGDRLPGLAMASRTVGSPQIRNRGTVGGNLGAASPAGDAHPPLLAAGSRVEVASVRGARRHRGRGLLHRGQAQRPGPGRADPRRPRHAADRPAAVLQDRHPQRDGHLGLGVRHRAAPRPQGRRHRHRLGRPDPAPGACRRGSTWPRRSTSSGCGSRGARCRRAWPRSSATLVSAAASPIDDVRGSAAYRLHSLSVMARRAATWAWDDYRKAA